MRKKMKKFRSTQYSKYFILNYYMNEYAKVFIMSYKKGGEWNPMSRHSMERFERQGFHTELVEGYNIKQHPEIKRSQIVYLNFLDKVLPLLKKKGIKTGFFVAEDDAYPNDFVTPDFLKKRILKSGFKNKIIRVGYQKVLKEKRAEFKNGYNCVGNQLLWIPKSQMVNLEKIMKKSKAQHLNGFFSKSKDIDVEILDPHVQVSKKTKYVLELEHGSLTTDRTRKGKRESSIARNNLRSKKLKFFNSQNNQPARLVPKSSLKRRRKNKL